MEKVILLANVDVRLNPYVELLNQALQAEGLVVEVVPQLGPVWSSKALQTAVLHLHWVESLYCIRAPSTWKSKWVRRLLCNRMVAGLRSVCRLSSSLLAIAVCKLRGAWIVYTVHNLESHSERNFDRLLHRITTWSVLRLANRVHVHNEAVGELVKARYRREDRMAVVPLGNYIGYYPRGISKSEARERLEIGCSLRVFLFFGLIRPYKGIEELIPAFLDLAPDPGGKLLLMVGATQSSAYEARIAAIIGAHPSIKLLPGFVPDEEIQVFLAAADLVVFPYRAATTSAGAILALSYGRPIIAPAFPAFSNLVTEQTGILYDPSKRGALTAALRAGAARDWDESRILEFAHRFDWQQIGPSLRALYERAPQRQTFGV